MCVCVCVCVCVSDDHIICYICCLWLCVVIKQTGIQQVQTGAGVVDTISSPDLLSCSSCTNNLYRIISITVHGIPICWAKTDWMIMKLWLYQYWLLRTILFYIIIHCIITPRACARVKQSALSVIVICRLSVQKLPDLDISASEQSVSTTS